MTRHLTSFALGLVLALLSLAPTTQAAPFALAGSEVRALPRSSNGREYTLYISLPESYFSSPNRKYPVVYSCDGYWDFSLLSTQSGNLRVDGFLPDCIIVGFAYSGTNPDVGALRQWDYTPGYDPYAGSNSGHASEFLQVVEKEFIPLIEREYRGDPSFRVLAGSSYGGLFTVYSMLERPGLFQGYVAVSPALWYMNRDMFRKEQEYRKNNPNISARLFLSFASEESGAIINATRDFGAQMKAAKYKNVAVATREITGERHSGTKGEGYTRGLRFVFAPLAPSPNTSRDPGFDTRSKFLNLSTRGHVGGSSGALIAGFIINGQDNKQVLIRAAGPSLSAHGVSGPLADPRLQVFSSTQVVEGENDNWADANAQSQLSLAWSVAGAFPFPANSRDSALLLSLPPGAHTAVVNPAPGTEGEALVEVYEMN